MTASKTTKVGRAAVGEASASGTVKVLRYQPMPEGLNAPAPRVGASSLTSPLMAQSWGRVTGAQERSLNAGSCAPAASDWRKCQPEVKGAVVRVWAGACE